MLGDMLSSDSESESIHGTLVKRIPPEASLRNKSKKSVGNGKLGKYQYLCKECKKVFRDEQIFKEHLRKHDRKHKWTMLPCRYCSKTFATRKGLKQHLPLHTGKYPYYCDECDIGMCHKRSWISHQRKHNGSVLKCKTCQETFATPKTLERHSLTHEGKERFNYKFHCEICSEVFSTRKLLIYHQMKHDGKRIKCRFCPETYANDNGLRRHMPVHTGKYLFHCRYCNAGFNQVNKITTHENKHQGKGFIPRAPNVKLTQ